MFGDQYIFSTCKLKFIYAERQTGVGTIKLCQANFTNKAHICKYSALFQYPDSSPTIDQHKAFESNFRLTGF